MCFSLRGFRWFILQRVRAYVWIQNGAFFGNETQTLFAFELKITNSNHAFRPTKILLLGPFFFQTNKTFFLTFFMHVSESQHFFSNLNSNFSNLLDTGNLQEQVKKAFCHKKLFRCLNKLFYWSRKSFEIRGWSRSEQFW